MCGPRPSAILHFESPQSGSQSTISHITEKERLRKERVHHFPPLRRVAGQEGHYTVLCTTTVLGIR